MTLGQAAGGSVGFLLCPALRGCPVMAGVLLTNSSGGRGPHCRAVPGALPAAGRPPPPLDRHRRRHCPRTCGGRPRGPPSKHVPCGLCRMSRGGVLSLPAWSYPLLLAELLGEAGPKPRLAHSGGTSSLPCCLWRPGVWGDPLEPCLCQASWLRSSQPHSHISCSASSNGPSCLCSHP